MINHQSIAASEHFAAALAAIIREDAADRLPDLSRVHVFIPNALAARQLRRQLVLSAGHALLGPSIGPMQQWLSQQIPLPHTELTPINQQARRLLLIEALNQHGELFPGTSSWQLCDSLLDLFDQLGQHNGTLLDSSEQAWVQRLQQAYGIDRDSVKLSREAKIVHTLWNAWQQQLQALGMIDSCSAYQQRLTSPVPISDQRFYIVGEDRLSPVEKAWCEQLSTHNQLTFIDQALQDEGPQRGAYTPVYDQTRPLLERARAFAGNGDAAPPEPPLAVFAASNSEQQAAAIDLQTRQWLLQRNNSIAIVTEDRKLARRVRALLERAGVRIQDTAGWSLSTTSAAACVERWLECIEEDFAYQPLLDLLKSPFFIADQAQREQHLNRVFRLEQDIIHHENIPGDIRRYQAALQYRHQRLAHWSADTYDNISRLLERLQQQAATLLDAYLHDRPRPAQHYLTALLDNLQQLGIRQQLQDDPAGLRILQVLASMQQSLQMANPQMRWSDFRTWLASSLEQQQFTPQDAPSSVYLMNMQQAQYCHFDGLIIAGANKASLPGSSSQSAFFNHRVKSALGLDNWAADKQAAYLRFRQFLHAADHILISYTAEQDGEWIQPSPWVSSLVDFYQLACGKDLQAGWLQRYFQHSERPADIPDAEAPVLEKHPGTPLAATLLPEQFSASRYQRLVNCPYQFFAADGLSLKPEEAVTRELLKSEYGEKVHLILYAFHSQVKHLPAPFPQPVTRTNREAALQHLVSLSKTVFATDLEDNVQHRGWLQRWLETTGAYIDWLIQRQQDWSIYQLEQNLEQDIDEHTRIKGRLDRIDQNPQGFSIIDYKTGSTASQSRVDSGEDVQLVSYAKLLEPVREVAYLKLDKGEVKMTAVLRDEQLDEIKQQSLQRLQSIIEAIRQGHKLHAWGDQDACRYCDMQGLCRKQIWENL